MTFNATEFEAALDDELITVDGITDLAGRSPPSEALRFADQCSCELNLDRMKLENAADHPVIEYKDESEQGPPAYRWVWRLNELCGPPDRNLQRHRRPQRPGASTQFISGRTRPRTAPPGCARRSSRSPRPATIGNARSTIGTSTYSWEIQDWDGDNLATLLPDERLTIRMTRRGDGTGELIDAVPFSRVLRFSANTLGNLGKQWTITTPGQVSRGARERSVYPTEATANIWKMHEECFPVRRLDI